MLNTVAVQYTVIMLSFFEFSYLHVAQVCRVLQILRSLLLCFDSSFSCDEVSIRFPVAPLIPVLQR